MNKNVNILDELDIFLNKAHWNNSQYKNFFDNKKNFYIEIFKILSNLGTNYFLIVNSRFPNLESNKDHEIIYIENFMEDKKLWETLNDSLFQIHKDKKGNFFILKFNILILVKTTYKTFFNKKVFYIEKNNEKINFYYVNNVFSIIQKKVISKIKKIIMQIKKRYYLIKLIGIIKYFTFSSEKKYEINYSQFSRLMIEPKDSVNWLLRKKHLDVITRNKKYLHLGKIIKYLKNENLLEFIKSNVLEVDTSIMFEEPVHLNRKFWEGGNNYFIYPIYFEFKKNVVAYKKSNDYIIKNKSPNIYSYEYYDSLASMTDDEIISFLKDNPIEITNNFITSGRHRVSAMCGRMIKGKKYLPLYVKISF